MSAPKYLADYADLWNTDPKAANLKWFSEAKWGLFMHYGLYSQIERGEWIMFHDKIPIDEYEKLFDTFDPKNFDADFITDLALEAEMKYVTLTACHHEGFCLWNSDTEAYNSYKACGRDLVREVAEACDRKGLGFFTYFTHVINWRHPHALTGEGLEICRPAYEMPQQRYEDLADKDKYWEWAHGCMRELLAMDAPLAGMWLDIIMAYYKAPHAIPIEATYDLIRTVRPEALISFKQGATGTEDFGAPEHSNNSLASVLRKHNCEAGAKIAEEAWEKNKSKHNEICTTLQEKAWGYHADVAHRDADDVWGRLANAIEMDCNLLANVGPLPDGSIHPEDVATLREMGKRIRERGWPGADDSVTPESWSVVDGGAAAG